MSEPKFKRGQTVTILSRNLPDSARRWENTHVGGNAIIESCQTAADGHYRAGFAYSIFLLFEDKGKTDISCRWFEEEFLELYCSNELRGLKILRFDKSKR